MPETKVCARQDCTNVFEPVEPSSLYCSKRCRRRAQKHHRIERAPNEVREPSSRQKKRILQRDGWICQICSRRTYPNEVPPHPLASTVDHIIPRSLGGTNADENLQCACYRCNHDKRDRIPRK